jgi:hypothetical protein
MGGTLVDVGFADACTLTAGVAEEDCLDDREGVMGAGGEDDEDGALEDVARAAICSMRAFQTFVAGALASSMCLGGYLRGGGGGGR